MGKLRSGKKYQVKKGKITDITVIKIIIIINTMVFLGVDYGRRNLGLSLSEGMLARPISSLRVKAPEKALSLIKDICQKEGVGKIVMGISEGAMAEETRDFGQKLAEFCDLPVEFWDETLSSEEAKQQARQIFGRLKFHKNDVHSLSAAITLQNCLDMSFVSQGFNGVEAGGAEGRSDAEDDTDEGGNAERKQDGPKRHGGGEKTGEGCGEAAADKYAD